MSVILVVDDDASVLRLLDVALSDLGEVVCVPSGDAALSWTADRLPDIVVLDVSMPGTSGLDVVRAWRSDPRTRDLDVVMLSGLDDPKDQAAGYNAGADAYVTKPVNIELLESLVEAMLKVTVTRRAVVQHETDRANTRLDVTEPRRPPSADGPSGG